MDIEENINSKRGRGRGRGTRSRGRGRGRGRGRAKKNTSRIVSSDEEMSQEQIEETVITDEITSTILTETVEDPISNKENENDPAVIEEPIIPPTIDMEADISQLEAPTFTTISRGPPEPMLRLKWDHKVSLIGEKVLNPMIHCCDQCDKPILVYGRMIPCKHIFCLKCARQEPIKLCPRCKDKVLRVEQSGLGTVFMCTHGGSRYGNNGCRRTYLSQRDLQAHINHRHITPQQQQAMSSETLKVTQIIDSKGLNITPRKSIEMSIASSSVVSTPTVARLPQRSSHQFSGGISSVSASSSSSSITPSSRGNLITVPLQEAQQALGKVNLQQQQVSSTVVSSLNQLSVHHHGPAAEQVASASYYSNALLSYSGPNRPHSHTSTHSSSSHGMTAQNYGSISTIGSQSGTAGGIPTPPPPVVTHTHNVPLVPPPAHLSSQQSVVPPPPPPAPPQAPAYYAAYGQQYGQMPHYQFDQTNYPPSGAPNPSQWNQQYYR